MKLTKENIAEIAVMVFDGKTSAQIAEHFNISIPTVNYHRMKFKKNGTKLQKGKNLKAQKGEDSVDLEAKTLQLMAPEKLPKAKAQDLQLKVNGMWVRIDKGAKMVQIHKDHIEISF